MPEALQDTASKPETIQGTISKPESLQDTASKPETIQGTISKPKSLQDTALKPETIQGTISKPESLQDTVFNPETLQNIGFTPTILAIFFLGGVSALILGWLSLRRKINLAEEKRKNLLLYAEKEAEHIKRQMIADTTHEVEQRRVEAEAEFRKLTLDIEHREKELKLFREAFEEDKTELKQKSEALTKREKELENSRSELDEKVKSYRNKMENLAELKPSEIKVALWEEVQRDCEDELRQTKQNLLEKGEKELRENALRVLIDTMQRMASEPQYDISATIVQIPSDDMKGRIIGREGRNIKSFESSTGTTLLIDETPDSVLISCFDPVRRETARIALETLIKDGRIHPTAIEEAVTRADSEMKLNVIEYGEAALRRLRLGKVHPDIVKLLGKMHYRQSYNQNSLDHSIEVSFLCSLMASELGLVPEIAKRAGLFHDIGKAMDHEYEGSHAAIGAQLLKRCGEDPRVVNATAAHHEEVPAESPYAGLLMIADSISAMRPGARAESMDAYVQRVQKLEEIALQLDGIKEAYAIQAGREIRVIVEPNKVNDNQARHISHVIRTRIEEELQYPGTIKITVVREQRFTETAK